MKNSILLILFMCFFNVITAQNIKGLVVDGDNNPLEFASIALLQQKDSLLIKYTTTGADGRFELSEFKENTYLFQVYLMTYQANQRVLKVTNLPINLGIIKLDKEVYNLNEVVVSAIVPIKIKQDTIAFNAKAFKVKQDDNVEDLIKKLPGVQIGTDGSVTAQGQEITKILVDGKEFFNNDPTIALKNLTADAIKSVQIIDEESDDARTTGIKDGEKTKIINLVLEDGKKTGYFGKMGAGIGTNDRYLSNFDLNRFTKNSQLAIFGNLNNINNTGAAVFSRDGSRGDNSGYLTTGTAGANYNYEFKKDLNFNLDYHFGHSDREQEESSNRTEFTSETSFTNEKEETSENISDNHNVNFSLRDRSKKDAYLEFRGNFKNDTRTSSNSSSTVFFDGDKIEDTNSNRETSSDDIRSSGKLNFSYRKKMNEKGRNIRLRSGLSFSDNDDVNYQNSFTKYNVSDITSYSESNEATERKELKKGLNYDASFRYMEPIIEHHLISFSTSFEANTSDESLDQRKTINVVEQNPFMYQLDYTNQIFENQLGYVYSKDKIQVYLSGSLETMKQKLDIDSNSNINNKYDNFLPSATVNYEYKKGKNLRFRYNKSTSLPSSNQVSPIINDFNPLSISVGNPNLTPEESNNINLRLYSHNFKSTASFFSYLNYSKTSNAIVTNRSVDENYVSNRSFENYGDKSNFRGMVHFGNKIKGIPVRYTVRVSSSINDYITIIDGAYNTTKTNSNSFGLSLSNDVKNNIDITIGANYDLDKTTYSLQDRDRDYFKQNYYSKFDWDITNSINFNTQFDYSLYTDNNFDSRTVPIWNVAVEYAFLKGKRGNLKFQVLDILDKNIEIDRVSSDNYFKETFKKSLGTYAMLSFTYSIKPPTGKESKRGSGESRRHHR